MTHTRWIMLAALVGAPCFGQGDGFDWVTIGDPGNEPYGGGEWGQTAGRGNRLRL